MNKQKIKLGMLGGGKASFIGITHRIAAYMTERYDLVGGTLSSCHEQDLSFAKDLGLDKRRIYPSLETLIKKENDLPKHERMEVVAVLTPNFLHFTMAKSLLQAGFHVICEKPMTVTAQEAVALERLVQSSGKQFALAHTYTGYPMVRQMKAMIGAGEIGEMQRVDVQYYQGWINPVIHEAEKRKAVWRLNPSKSGISCCMADIGVHGFHLLEYTTGTEVEQLLSDLNTLYDDNPLDVDGTVLLRLKGGAKGVLRASQIATGEENQLTLQAYGQQGALKWRQENPNELVFLQHEKPIQMLKPGQPYLSSFAAESVKMAPGHPEGIFDAMGNIYKGIAQAIRGEATPHGAFPTVSEGVRGMRFIEKVVQSHQQGNVWLNL